MRRGASLLTACSGLLAPVTVTAVALLATPVEASAHLRSGTVAVDYRASVAAPEATAYTAQIYQSDRALGLSLKAGHSVLVLGYLGEPMLRLDATGLWVNVASPTSVVAGLVSKSRRVVASAPRWRLQRGRRSVTWRDGRVQALASGVNEGAWSVPLIVDGARTRLDGTLRRFPKPALWPWLATLAGALAAVVLLLLSRSRESARTAAITLSLVAAAASVVVAFAFSLDPYASPGTWIASFDELFFVAIGIGALWRGPARWHLPAAIGLGLLAVAVAISKGAIFLHPIVLAVLPATITRLAVIIALDSGLAAAILGAASYTDTLRADGPAVYATQS